MTDEIKRPITFILHVGAPKTGSTALQRIFDNNKQPLADAGVAYFNQYNVKLSDEDSLLSSGNANDLFDFISNSVAFSESFYHTLDGLLKPHIDNIDEKYDYCIISSENFYYLSIESLKILIDRISFTSEKLLERDSKVKIVFAVRDIVSHCISFYCHNVRRFLYEGDILSYAQNSYDLLILEKLEEFSSITGAELIVLQYASAVSMAADLFHKAGADDAAAIQFVDQRINVGLGAGGLQLVRQFGLNLTPGSWSVDRRAVRCYNELLWKFGDYLESLNVTGDLALASTISESDMSSLEKILLSRANAAGYPCQSGAFLASGISVKLNALSHKHRGKAGSNNPELIQKFCLDYATGRRRITQKQNYEQSQFHFIKNSGIFNNTVYRKNCQKAGLLICESASEYDLIAHFVQHGLKENISCSKEFDFNWYKSRYAFLGGIDLFEHYLLQGRAGGFVGSSQTGYPGKFGHPLWSAIGKRSIAELEGGASELLRRFCRYVDVGDYRSAMQDYPSLPQALRFQKDWQIQVYAMHNFAMFNLNFLNRIDFAASQFREAAAEISRYKSINLDSFIDDIYWSSLFHFGLSLRCGGKNDHALAVKEILLSSSGLSPQAPAWVFSRLSELS